MRQQQCRVCEASCPQGASFCATCGANLDATVVEVADEAPPNTVGQRPVTLASRLAVPVLAVGLVGLVGFVLLAGGGTGGGDDVVERGLPATPTADPSSRDETDAVEPSVPATATPSQRSPATPTPSPDVAELAAVDPALLPTTTATHLAIGYGSTLRFLDLADGRWSQSDITGTWAGGPAPGGGLYPFGSGVLIHDDRGQLLHISVDGGEPQVIGDGFNSWLMGVRNDVAYVQRHRGDGTTVVEGFAVDGSLALELELPPAWWASGVAADGRVIVQAGSGIHLIGPSRSSQLAVGDLVGVVDDYVLVYDCDAQLTCATDLVHTTTGERSATPLPPGYVEVGAANTLHVHSTTSDTFRLVDGEVVPYDDATPRLGGLASAVAEDGTVARLTFDSVELQAAESDEVVTIPYERPSRCCAGPISIALLTLPT